MRFAEFLTELSNFKELRKNQTVLTADEKEKIKKEKATWSDGRSAVWKSTGKDGKVVFITHTHRAFNTAPTLKGIINRFHNFIKGTA